MTETAPQVWDLANFTYLAYQVAGHRAPAPFRTEWHDRDVPPPAEVPVAASDALRAQLAAPVRPAVVRAVFPTAIYLDTGDDVVAVVTTDGLRLPCALVVAAGSGARPFAHLRTGALAGVGAGVVRLGGQQLVVRRWWRPRRAQPVHPGPGLAARTDELQLLLPALPDELPTDPASWRPRRLLGLGGGLTPAGDDVLAGMLLTLQAAPVAATEFDGLACETADLLSGTTSLSACLLRHAAAGRGIRQVVDVVDALTGSGDLEGATVRLLAVGHTSGTALAHGIVAASRLVNAADTTRAA